MGTARHGAARRSAGCGSWPAAWEAVRSEVYLSQGSNKHQMDETSGGAASQPDQSLRGSVGRAGELCAMGRRAAEPPPLPTLGKG